MKTTMRCVYINGPEIASYDITFKREGSEELETRKQEYLQIQANELPETTNDKRINRWNVALWSYGNRELEMKTTQFFAKNEEVLKNNEHVLEMDVSINTYRDRGGLGGIALHNVPRIVPAKPRRWSADNGGESPQLETDQRRCSTPPLSPFGLRRPP